MAQSAERVTVAWLKHVLATTSVATSLPAKNIPWPFVTVAEIGGGDTGIDPVDRPYMQIDCYHATDRAAADDIALAVVDAAKYGWPWTSDEGGTVMAADIVAKRSVPEPGTRWHRFAVDVIVFIRDDTFKP